MRYYFRENIRRYEIMTRMSLENWAKRTYGGTDFHDFSSRNFLSYGFEPIFRHGEYGESSIFVHRRSGVNLVPYERYTV